MVLSFCYLEKRACEKEKYQAMRLDPQLGLLIRSSSGIILLDFFLYVMYSGYLKKNCDKIGITKFTILNVQLTIGF